MCTDAWVEADAVNNLTGIQTMTCRISIELVKVSDAHGKVSVGEQLDGLGLVAAGEERQDVLLHSTLLEQVGESFGTGGLFADDDTAGIQVVVEGAAFAQELGGEDEVLRAEGCPGADGVTDRNGGFDDHHRLWVDSHYVQNHLFDGLSIEIIGRGVVVSGGGDDDVVGTGVCIGFIKSCEKV